MRKQAKKTGRRLIACLDGGGYAEVVALTECAPRYCTPAFRCANGAGWYPLNGAAFEFFVK